jgi:DNA invertase Pin-like site-specific DNA recombinase
MHFVTYYRVSTKEQEVSGLGLNAQRTAATNFLKAGQSIIKEFTEAESGNNNDRPILQDAIRYAQHHRATLLIAKLDRLARNVAFIFALRDSGVDFVCADIPDANTLTIGIFATMAQHEREIISDRTKKALAEKKAQGTVLGTPGNLSTAAALKGAEAMANKARKNFNNRRAAAMIKSLIASGNNYSEIARQLNATGFTTSTGRQFQATQVKRLSRFIST